MQHFGVCKKRAFGIPMPLPVLLNNKYRQAVRIMKITAFILLVCTLHVSAGGFSQTISLSEKEAPLTKVFKAIEKQTDYIFFYNTEWVKKAERVNVEVKNMQLQQVLDLLFKNQPITYSITGKMITLFPKKDDEQASPNQNLTSPPLDIHGKVVDENGKPVAGVTVTVKGTKKETITNENGEFSFTGVESNAILIFSSVNMETFTINVSGRREILAKLKIKTSELDEVQVIAYGQTTKRFQTGNVTTLKATDIEKQPVSNPLLALQGRVPGLFITQTNGLPGGGVTVRIQGRNSINYGNDPFFVIDGVPFFSQLPSTGVDGIFGTSGGMVGTNSNGNPLSYLNPMDIESIEVLKDADATAIYGSRAANGAILITTKKGKAGQMKFDLNAQTGWGQVARKLDMLDTRQYLDMRYEALKNDGVNLAAQSVTNSNYFDLKVWDTTRYTDWQKELIGGTARYNYLTASISGGSPLIQYLVSGTYRKETTVFPGNFNDQKGSVHFNLTGNSANQKLKVEFSGSYGIDNNRLLRTDLTRMAVQLEPNAPELYKIDGSLNWASNSAGVSTWTNPFIERLRKYRNNTNSLVGNFLFRYQLFSSFSLQTSMGYTSLHTEDFSGTPLPYYRPEQRANSFRTALYGNRNLNSWIIEPQLNYKRNVGKGSFDFLLGGTLQQNTGKSSTVVGTGYNNDEVLENMTAATSLTATGQYNSQYKYSAFFSRFSFNWDNKYIMNLAGRRDGSSRFGASNQFHNFGSVGAAWIFTEESLLKRQHLLSFGKLRASYGTTGSDQIGDYSYLSLYDYWASPTIPYQNSSGIVSTGLSNSFIEWEETKKIQVGVSLGFIADRIIIDATYSRNRSSNQLLVYNLPSIAGYFGILRNFPATVQNRSWEFSASSTNINGKNFKWVTQINLTLPENKLIAFPDLENSTYFNSLFIGKPVGVRIEYPFAGVDPATGKYQFRDSKGNLTTSPSYPADATSFINTNPKFYGGIQNNFRYKKIELDIFIQFVKQLGLNNSYMNGSRWPGRFVAGQSNQPVTVLDRWQKTSDEATIAKYSTSANYFLGTGSYTDASYARLKNLSLSFIIPEKWQQAIRFKNCKIYTQGQNLITITKWKGLDPESQTVSSLPPLRVWTLGLIAGL